MCRRCGRNAFSTLVAKNVANLQTRTIIELIVCSSRIVEIDDYKDLKNEEFAFRAMKIEHLKNKKKKLMRFSNMYKRKSRILNSYLVFNPYEEQKFKAYRFPFICRCFFFPSTSIRFIFLVTRNTRPPRKFRYRRNVEEMCDVWGNGGGVGGFSRVITRHYNLKLVLFAQFSYLVGTAAWIIN